MLFSALKQRLLQGLRICLLFSAIPSAFAATSNTETRDLFSHAKVALSAQQLDKAQRYIEEVLISEFDNTEVLVLAGQIAAVRAKKGNLFLNLFYSRDAKHYFEQALSIDPQNRDAILGLIDFHQQAQVMAGAEKESIPPLVTRLKVIDKPTAFSFEAEQLIRIKQFELLHSDYVKALNDCAPDNREQFKFDHAMRLSSYGYYSNALDILLSIKTENKEAIVGFSAMYLYQLAKLSAESQRELALGLESIEHYAKLPKEQRSISDDWVTFRKLQLKYLENRPDVALSDFYNLKGHANDNSLSSKISRFVEENSD